MGILNQIKKIQKELLVSDTFVISNNSGKIITRKLFYNILSLLNSLQDTKYKFGDICDSLKKIFSDLDKDNEPDNDYICIENSVLNDLEYYICNVRTALKLK